MGNRSSNPLHSVHTLAAPKKNFQNKMYKRIYMTIKGKYDHTDYLSYDDFNTILEILSTFTFRTLSQTPLSRILFDFLDKEQNAKINKNDFLSFLPMLTSSETWQKCLILFSAFTQDVDESISVSRLVEYLVDSWNFAFSALLTQLQTQKHFNLLHLKDQIQSLSKTQLNNFKKVVSTDLYGATSGKDEINKMQFVQWAHRDHTISLVLGDIEVHVAVCLNSDNKAIEINS